jgi:hypothetical protein
MNRKEYEAEVVKQLEQWRDQISSLYRRATDNHVPEDVGDERTQVEKLQGQWEMAWDQFNQLRAMENPDAWNELRPGIDQKLQRLESALSRTRQQIGESP